MRRFMQLAAVLLWSTLVVPAILACDATDDTDYLTSLERAKKLERPLLLAFLGTDWSMNSLKLDREVFDQTAFADNTKYDFLLCKLHFYQTQERPPEIYEQNRGLAEKYRIEQFPTVVVFDPNGVEIGRLGYSGGGLEKFGTEVNALIKKHAGPKH